MTILDEKLSETLDALRAKNSKLRDDPTLVEHEQLLARRAELSAQVQVLDDRITTKAEIIRELEIDLDADRADRRTVNDLLMSVTEGLRELERRWNDRGADNV